MEIIYTKKFHLFHALWSYTEVTVKRCFAVLLNSSIPTDSGRLKEVISLGGVTFYCYGDLNKQLHWEVYYAEKCLIFLHIMDV